jgi:ribosomal protein S18 acetylase RimI-like enzyme
MAEENDGSGAEPMTIRPSLRGDVEWLAKVADATELFPGEMLPGMMGAFLSGGDSPDIWLTCEAGGQVAGFCYAVPEKLTDGTWNMLAIAVHPSRQGTGAGSAIVRHLEAALLARGQRVIIADTSGTPEFERTRGFYRKNGYREEARIRDFWAEGNDKVVFWKRLGQSTVR